MTTHPAREAGQRVGTGYGCTYRDSGGWYSCNETDDGRDGWVWWTDGVTVGLGAGEAFCPKLSPSASPASGPPEGYRLCPNHCGNWIASTTLLSSAPLVCWRCWDSDPDNDRLANDSRRTKFPDWTPPLESKAAETGTAAQKVLVSAMDASYKALRALGAPPAQEAPKVPKCGNSGCKTPYQNVAQRWCAYSDGSRRVMLKWSCEPCHLLDEKEFAELMMFESSGTPYAGPERLPRPKMAHSHQWPDEAGDVQ